MRFSASFWLTILSHYISYHFINNSFYNIDNIFIALINYLHNNINFTIMEIQDYSTAKKGDYVWNSRLGDGEIVDIINGANYPLIVKFPKISKYVSFTIQGKYYEIDKLSSLFKTKLKTY